MQNRLGNRQSLKTTVSTRVDPKVVLSSKILLLSQPDLMQEIERELDANPALERIDEPEAAITEEDILKAVAPRELKPSSSDYEATRSLPNDHDGTDWTELAASNDTLWDHLFAQLRPKTERRFFPLLEYIVGSVNDRGYLTCSVEDAANDCRVSLEEAEKMLKALQSCEPAGVGATSIRECLLLQLRDATEDDERMARFMIKNCWDELVSKNTEAVCRKHKADPELVEAAHQVILSLNPFPGEGYALHSHMGIFERTNPATPDIQFTLDEAGWVIEILGPSPMSLRVSRSYLHRQSNLLAMARPNRDEKRHIEEFIGRARIFKEALEQRRWLLGEMGKYLIAKQGGFISTGDYQFLKPLTRSKLARDLKVHESTISRATNSKFCMLPNGEIVAFEVFFKPALRVQKMIEGILYYENLDNPMSDERIREMLAQKGVKIARRTVNKYRSKNRQLSSRQRKSA